MSNVSVPMLDRETVERLLDYPSLIQAIRQAFIDPPVTAPRLAIPIAEAKGQPAGSLLVMPAHRSAGLIGVKIVTIQPSLSHRSGGAVRATYVALDAATGELRGLVDGHALTLRRTAATSALAALELARADSGTLLVVGTGAVAEALAQAYTETFRLHRVWIWGRRAERALTLANSLVSAGIAAEAVSDLRAALQAADIVTCATLSTTALVSGADVRPGTHVDLVGGFTREMREGDDSLISKATVVADVETTLMEAGDLAQPLKSGLIAKGRIALLHHVLLGSRPGRSAPEEITLFKSAGHALEDLAAAELLFQRWPSKSEP